MDSVFRSAKEKLEKEHRESKENGKLVLEREKKDKEAAERQRRAVEASQRAKRLETIEILMNKVEPADRKIQAAQAIENEDNLGKIYYKRIVDEDDIKEAIPIPPWMKTQRIAQKRDYDVFERQVGDAPGTGKGRRLIGNVREEEETKNNKKKTTDVGKKTEKQMD